MIEIEKKFLAQADDLKAMLNHFTLPDGYSATDIQYNVHHQSRYYDTFDLDFFKAGIALRVRAMAHGDYEQTMKVALKPGDIEERKEINLALANDKPQWEAFKNHFHLENADRLIDSLIPIFDCNVMRTSILCEQDETPDGQDPFRVELDFDLGHIIVEDQSEEVAELEMELKSGTRDQLDQFARNVRMYYPFLQLSNISKAQRGFTLYRSILDNLPN